MYKIPKLVNNIYVIYIKTSIGGMSMGLRDLLHRKKSEKTDAEMLRDFIDKRGFYIVLMLCVIIIAATAFTVTMRNYTISGEQYLLDADGSNAISEKNEDATNTMAHSDNNELEQNASSISISNIAPSPSVSVTQPKDKPEDVVIKPTKPSQNEQPKKDNSETKNIPPKTIKLIYPVFGKTVLDYAKTELVYSNTLEEWTTHSGLDIASQRGTPVKAAAAGTVTSIKHDPRYGITITIDHGSGLRTVYSNLSSDNMVSSGAKVKQNQIISGVGDTASYEIKEDSHLHFEVIKDGENVDPSSYLPKL
jgi:murein DD-endopeptidase MepM/ murein hydrolase activator NlpD